MNSWLLSMRWPDFSATARAIAMASVNDNIVSASAIAPSSRSVRTDSSGSDSGGRLRGIASTVAMPMPLPKAVCKAAA